MSNLIKLKVPDIGDVKDVDVIEVFVKAGDVIKKDDALITLETDKASMEVPAEAGGVVKEVRIKVGDKASQGTVIVLIEAAGAAAASTPAATPAPAPAAAASSSAAATSASIEVKVPDIGDAKNVDVIEVFVKAGDTVKKDDSLITLETDKASMEVPSPAAGTVQSIAIKVGDKASEGTLILTLAASGASHAVAPAAKPAAAAPAPTDVVPVATPAAAPAPIAAPASAKVDEAGFKAAHASPSVRKFARELGVDLGKVKGTGPKGRIIASDVQAFVKSVLSGAISSGAPSAGTGVGLDLLPWPKVDFAKYGPVESKPLSRIKKISGANLARNWVMIPHVTQFDEADITDMEAFRKDMGEELKKQNLKITPLAFIIKAVVAALKKFPEFNSSLDGDNLVLKQYFHIGFAADTPNGLVVPVIRDADKKSLIELATETGALAAKAREGKLLPAEMQGGCFSISSLGGVGGTAFTPIVNAPEVAILGVSKSSIKPVWNGSEFTPRLMLPLSLSYDHRVIDGASAARFTTYLSQVLGDIRRLML
ncbi:dihydrolipoyllysine-residue acetyltransferase [Chitinimonas sp. PSY-7]|uniref:dihydrolipoyllysine-residue acetyltransferase n=1 Tax=Chitinimonas sp. PSY-7 TaxID=3459088 RepID=UPI0040403D31